MDPFRTLGVDPDADTAQIRTAYRTRARAHHPDRGGDATAFAQVHEAYRRALAIRRGRHRPPPPPGSRQAPPSDSRQAPPPSGRPDPDAGSRPWAATGRSRSDPDLLGRFAATDPAILVAVLSALVVQVGLLSVTALSSSTDRVLPVVASLAAGVVTGAALFVLLQLVGRGARRHR